MKKIIPVLLVLVLLVVLTGRTTAAPYVPCIPNTYPISSTYTEIDVGDGFLEGRFVYPDPPGPVDIVPESLSGVAMTTGFGSKYADLETQARQLAAQCTVVLVYNYRGQGLDPDRHTDFNFYEEQTARDDLDAVANKLITGPLPGVLDLVDDSRLGMLGFSQAGFVTWLAVADHGLRGRFRAVAPYDGVPFLTSLLLPQDCFNTNIGNYFSPSGLEKARWNQTAFTQLRDAYFNQDIATWKTAIAARDPSDDLAQPHPDGTPYPPVLDIGSWYDGFQPAQEAIDAYGLLTPPPPTPGYPNKRLVITTGAPGHTDAPWADPPNTFYREEITAAWLNDYLFRSYLNPTPTPTTGPAPTSPSPVEYLVDSFNNDPPDVVPTFEVFTDTVWPPAGTTTVTLYLRAGGQALPTLPEEGGAYDVVSQVLTDTNYTIAAAVAVTPTFAGWSTHFLTTTQVYTSPALAQDITLLGPITATLYIEPENPLTMDTYQVHVRVLNQIGESNTTAFITRANACAWDVTTPPAYLNGTPFRGETRAHRFKAGDHIVLEFTPIDVEEYKPSVRALFMTPYLGKFTLKVWREPARPSNVTLPVLLSDPGQPIFVVGGGTGTQAGMPENQPEGTPEPPQPLTLDAYLAYEDANPGGWRAWAPEVRFTCTGGQAPVACPETQYLDGDGLNQTFVFTATDAAGTVATDTITALSVDRTPPQLTESLPENQTFCSTGTLALDFSVSDALSGVDWNMATFNGEEVAAQANALLLPGLNVLHVDMRDVAGNRVVQDVTVQVNYDATLEFPAANQTVNPTEPLFFAFRINDFCATSGYYGEATATLWLTGPDGVAQPAIWNSATPGNFFAYDTQTGWYTFDADVSGLAAGTWTARVHLNDGNDYEVNLIIP